MSWHVARPDLPTREFGCMRHYLDAALLGYHILVVQPLSIESKVVAKVFSVTRFHQHR